MGRASGYCALLHTVLGTAFHFSACHGVVGIQYLHILQYIYPTLKLILALVGILSKAGHLKVYQPQLVREEASLAVRQSHIDAQLPAIACQHEVGEGYDVPGLDVVIFPIR